MSFLHLSTGGLAHSSCVNCSSSPRFEGCLLPTAVLRSPHTCSMGFISGLIAGHFRTVQRLVLNLSWVLFEVCLGSLCCCKTYDLRWRLIFLIFINDLSDSLENHLYLFADDSTLCGICHPSDRQAAASSLSADLD